MSEEMAVSDNTTGDEAKVSNNEATTPTVAEPEEMAMETPIEPVVPAVEEPPALAEEDPSPEIKPKIETKLEVKEEPESDYMGVPPETPDVDLDIKKEEEDDVKDEFETFEHNIEEDLKRGIKRRASAAFSDVGDEEFKGFDEIKLEVKAEDYSRILERLEAEVTAASRDLVPLRTVMATPPAPSRASKRPRKDTEGSRPSSALSSRSDGDGATDASAASSPAQRGGRRATIEMSSPLLRVPLERGWKRELVYRAALDAHSRRNADIYYYTPYGKKLRSTREVSEHLSGTGLTVDHFSFFKEPLGVDDPEKEIIRDAKMIRRVDSPVAATVQPVQVEGKRTPKPKVPKGASPEPVPPASAAAANKSPPAKIKVEGKRTPKPKVPKGASPEPVPPASAAAANKSPPAKIKVKSMGSRLSNCAPPAAPTPPAKQQKKPPPQPPQQQQPPQLQQQPPPTTVSNTDNNNSAAWKKPSNEPPARVLSGGECSAHPARPPPPTPPPLQGRPPVEAAPEPSNISFAAQSPEAVRSGAVQPCSMSCGRGAVPSLSCAACLCLYHPACAGHMHAAPPDPFFCKNCRKTSSPPIEPPPLTHKSGITTTSIQVPVPIPVPVPVLAPVPRRVPVPVPVPVPTKVPRDKRVLLRMKVAGGTPDGERVWAVAGTPPVLPAAPAPAPTPAPLPVPIPVPVPVPVPVAVAARARAPRPALPQGLAILNGRRFVVVPRNMVHAGAGHAAK